MNMDRKDLEPTENSSLPLANDDSGSSLVEDLPDGQKLVVGNLDPGTIVEVATWRGTGRPDSRTNRLMLGVTKEETSAQPQIPQYVASETQEAQSGFEEGIQPERTGIIYSNLNPVRETGQIATLERIETKDNSVRKRVLIAGATISSIALLAYVLFGVNGLQFARPSAGIGTSLGGASTAVVVIKPNSDLIIGKSVIADIPNSSQNPVIAVVAAIDTKAVLLGTESGYSQVRPELVRGKIVAVLPFVGTVINFFDQN